MRWIFKWCVLIYIYIYILFVLIGYIVIWNFDGVKIKSIGDIFIS